MDLALSAALEQLVAEFGYLRCGIVVDVLTAAGIPSLPSPARVARAMAMLADYAEALARPHDADPLPAAPDLSGLPLPDGAVSLDEQESKGIVQRAGVPIICGPEGSDSSAIVFDGVKKATAEGIDVLIVDTAGRLRCWHSNAAGLLGDGTKLDSEEPVYVKMPSH